MRNSSCIIIFIDASTLTEFITVELVHQCIEGLKNGKAASVDGLTAEHIYFAHPISSVHLALLFVILYKRSMVPEDFGRCVVVPLLKNVDGNKFTT